MKTPTFEVPIALFDKLTGLGELLLGNRLHAVLVKVGVIDRSEPLRGFTLLEAADRFVKEPRTEGDKLAEIMGCLRKAKSDVDHISHYLGRRKQCFCKDLDGGEHASYPACSFCVLGRLEFDLKKALEA